MALVELRQALDNKMLPSHPISTTPQEGAMCSSKVGSGWNLLLQEHLLEHETR